MRIVFLIMAHDHPAQLKRLTNALHDFDDYIFIHINKSSDFRLFSEVDWQPRVNLIPNRVYVHWGGFSMVEATLHLLQAARAHPAPFDYYCLLSSSDYPIRSSAYIHAYFEDGRHGEAIRIFDAMQEEKIDLLPRLQYFVFERGLRLQPLFNLLLFHINTKILRTALFERNYSRHLNGLKPYIGGPWWALSDRTITYIFEFVESHPKLVNFYRHTAHPLEMFFHTIIGNSPIMNDVSDTITYTAWLPHTTSPLCLTDDHVDDLKTHLSTAPRPGHHEFLFARKFSPDRQDLLDRIDTDFRGMHVAREQVTREAGPRPRTIPFVDSSLSTARLSSPPHTPRPADPHHLATHESWDGAE